MLIEEPNVQVIESLFNELFESSEKTILVSGAEEPIYQPSNEKQPFNIIFSTKDYFSSALHEISHWCVAGIERRKLVDYGYWYKPDGRNKEQQLLFENVEIKPQALEWLFTKATGQRFRLSVDNINHPEMKPSHKFKVNVESQAHVYLSEGLPDRAQLFFNALHSKFRKDKPTLKLSHFNLSSLD